MKDRIYLCIDLKSFFASVECVERGLDPLTTNLVVADKGRTEKTICLAVSPSLKSYGISGRARLFEVVRRVNDVNREKKFKLKGKELGSESYDDTLVKSKGDVALGYIAAPPRMALYMEYSTRVYNVYLKYVAPEDIHIYSIDEVFMDITDYLSIYNLSAGKLAAKILRDVFETTGITATAGIGTNMYLAKIAMDIVAKHTAPGKDGERIAGLDVMSYRKKLWGHKPITDFWRVGPGIAKRLETIGIFTMGDVARCSLTQEGENLLYKIVGVNAELLIDHAWGFEPCTIADVKAYRPENRSISSGQVLHEPYSYEKTKIIVKEMTELLVLELVKKRLKTDQIVLTCGYDIENLTNAEIKEKYKGEITKDVYGRLIPKHAHGTANLGKHTSSTSAIMNATVNLYERIIDKDLLVRRINLVANHVIDERTYKEKNYEQLDMFSDDTLWDKDEREEKERSLQETVIGLKAKYGKNAILKGNNFQKGATSRERNKQIGGHKA